MKSSFTMEPAITSKAQRPPGRLAQVAIFATTFIAILGVLALERARNEGGGPRSCELFEFRLAWLHQLHYLHWFHLCRWLSGPLGPRSLRYTLRTSKLYAHPRPGLVYCLQSQRRVLRQCR